MAVAEVYDPTTMKRKTTKSKGAAANLTPSADRTLHIEWPWSMTWMEYVDDMLAYLKSRIGPGHPLHGKKLYVTAVNEDADAWFVDGEKEDFYAIVYFGQKKRYGTRLMPRCEILADWDAVLARFAADHKEAMSKIQPAVHDTRAQTGEGAEAAPDPGRT